MKRIFKQYLRLLTDAKIFVGIFAAAFILGVTVGALFCARSERLMLTEKVVDFYVKAFSDKGSVFSLVFALALADALFLLIFYGFSFNLYLAIPAFFFMFYRGYILGAVAILFFTRFGVSGAFLYVLCVFLHNVIVTASLICFAGISARLLKCGKACLRYARRDLLFISAAAIVAALLLNAAILLVVLRPISSF